MTHDDLTAMSAGHRNERSFTWFSVHLKLTSTQNATYTCVPLHSGAFWVFPVHQLNNH